MAKEIRLKMDAEPKMEAPAIASGAESPQGKTTTTIEVKINLMPVLLGIGLYYAYKFLM